MPFLGNHPQSDKRWIDTLERARRRADAAAASWSAAEASRLDRIAGQAPWMTPGVTLALVKGGAGPDTVITVAKAQAASRLGQKPNNVVRGERVKGRRVSPGDRRLFGRQREEHYFKEIQPKVERQLQRERYEKAFLGMPPGQRREGMSQLDDLMAAGLMDAQKRLHAPEHLSGFTVEGKYDPERAKEVAPEKAAKIALFMETLEALGRPKWTEREKPGPPTVEPETERVKYWPDVPFVLPDGETALYDPQTKSLYRAPGQEEATFDLSPPELEAVGQALKSAWEFFLEQERPVVMTTGGNIPGQPSLQEAAERELAGETAGPLMVTGREGLQATTMAAEAPIQEFQGLIRNAYGEMTGRDVNWLESQSDWGIMLSTDMDPGGGVFVDPDSEVAQERVRREAKRGQIYGQNITLGRIATGGLARAGVINPHDNWYRALSGIVDLVPQVLDPTALAAGYAGKGLAARKLFRAAPEIGGAIRRTVSTSKLRSVARTLGVRGRGNMSRDELLAALRAYDPARQIPQAPHLRFSTAQLRGIGEAAGVEGAGRMSREALLGAIDPGRLRGPQLQAAARAAGIRGRSRMRAGELRDALRLTDPAAEAAGVDQLRHLAGLLGVTGRQAMSKDELIEALRGKWMQLDEEVVEGVTEAPGATKRATPRLLAGTLGAAEGLTRVTGLPQLAERAGLIKGSFLRGVHGPTTEAWMNGREGRRIINEIAQETSAAKIWENTGKKLTRAEVRALRDADTPEAVREVLRPMLQKNFRTVDEVWTSRTGQMPIVQQMRDSRALTDIPGTYIDVDDAQSPMKETQNWLRNAHVDPEVEEAFLNEMAEADSFAEIFDVVERIMVHTDGVLAKAGVPLADRRRMARAWRQEVTEAQNTFITEATTQQKLFDEIVVGDKPRPTGGPFQWTNYYQRYIYLPDFREVRRVTSRFPNWAWDAGGQLVKPAAWLQAVQDDFWKPMQLLRVAWPVRVIAEEQLRMAAVGKASMFRDPLSWAAFVVGRKRGITGELYDAADEYQRARVRRTAGWLTERPGRVRTAGQRLFAREEEGYLGAWAETIADLHDNPVSRRLAASRSIDEVETWLRTTDEGQAHLARLIQDHPEYFAHHRGVREYLENGNHWLSEITSGNDELLDAIATGKLRGKALTLPDQMSISKGFYRNLGDYLESAGPREVLGSEVPTTGVRNSITEKLFGWLMGTPTNVLSRSPVFRQAYWQRVEEMIQFASPEVKEEILTHARSAMEAGWGPFKIRIREAPNAAIRRMRHTDAVGRLTLDEVDHYAKGFALDETKELLYEMTKRSQLADSLRLVFPFGEAWREVLTRWATLMNPGTGRGIANWRRFQQLWQGATGEDLGEFLGAPPGEGFFWQDEWDEWRFYYPGSQWITASITDALGERVPVPLAARVRSLNMFGEIVPGLGPAASIPASYLLPDRPGPTRAVRDFLLPFGSVLDDEGLAAVPQWLNWAPAWMQRGFQVLTDGGWDTETNRIFANATMKTANYLYSTGRYDTTTKEGKNKLMEDARKSAGLLYGVMTGFAFGGPAVPKLDFLVEADEGLLRYGWLTDEYRRLVRDEGYEHADEIFLERFGPLAGMTMQSLTREVAGGVAPTQDFGDWARNNQDLRKNYPAIWGYFGPHGGDFDYRTYLEQIRSGEREALTLDEWFRLGQNHLGLMLRDALLAKLGPESEWTEAHREIKAQIEERIADDYEGYGDFTGTEQRPKFEDNIVPQINDAVEDPDVLATEAGQGLRIYWEVRRRALEEIGSPRYNNGRGYKTLNGQAVAGVREALYAWGRRIAQDYPDFSNIWNRQLRYEVMPEEEEEEELEEAAA